MRFDAEWTQPWHLWLSLVIAVLVIGVGVFAKAPAADVTVTITNKEAAAVAWVLTAPAPERLGTARTFASAPAVLRWMLDEPMEQLVARHQAALDAVEDPTRRTVYERMKALTAAQCLEVAKRLGIEVTALPCGGGQ
jgi:ABC-type taurine transport system ATPase subunit